MDDTIRTAVPRSGEQPIQSPLQQQQYNPGPPRPPLQNPNLNGNRPPFQPNSTQQNLVRPQGPPPQQQQLQQQQSPQQQQPLQQRPILQQQPNLQQQQQQPRPLNPNQGQQPQQFPAPQGGVRPPPLQQTPSQQFIGRPQNPNAQPILNPNPNIRGPPQQQIQPQQLQQQPLQQQQPIRNPPPQGAPRPQFQPQNPNQPPQQFRPPQQQGAPGQPQLQQQPPQQYQPPQNLNRPNFPPQNPQGVRPLQPGQPRPPYQPGQPGQPLQSQPSMEHIKSPLGRDSPDRNIRMASELIANKPDSPKGNFSSLDDDDDVVIGRALTPNKTSPLTKSPDYQINSTNRSPSEVGVLQRNDSSKSIPSRPPSALGNFIKTSSPEPVQTKPPFDRQKSPSPEQVYSRPSSQQSAIDRMKQQSPDSGAIMNRPPMSQDPYAPAAAIRRTPTDQQPPPINRYPQAPPPEGIRTTPPNMMRPHNPDLSKTPSPDSGAPGPGYMVKPPMTPSHQQHPQQGAPRQQPRQPVPQLQSAGRIHSPNPTQQAPTQSPKSPVNLNSIINPERVTFSLPNEYDDNTQYSKDANYRRNPNPVPNQQYDKRPQNLSMERPYDRKKGDNDSGVDESTQEKERNGPLSPASPLKSPTKIPGLSRPTSITPQTRSRSQSKQRASLKTPETPVEPVKKVPMNKIQVGATPSPNLKVVKSKIGSLQNTTHKPGGGNVKIETKKVDIKAAPRIEAKNESYQPRGGDKKIITNKLQWTAKSKIGSLDNAAHKPGGGDKKIETMKANYYDKAKPKIGSKDNLKYQPGGGDVKASSAGKSNPNSAGILNQKIEIKAESKIGSLDNVKHKPGGGDKKIFDDKEYLKQIEHPIPITPPSQMFSSGNWGRSRQFTSLSTSLSLPAECLVLSVTTPSPMRKIRRVDSMGPRNLSGRAFHPMPFRNY